MENDEMLEYGADGKRTSYGIAMEIRRHLKEVATGLGIYKLLDWMEGKLSKHKRT